MSKRKKTLTLLENAKMALTLLENAKMAFTLLDTEGFKCCVYVLDIEDISFYFRNEYVI